MMETHRNTERIYTYVPKIDQKNYVASFLYNLAICAWNAAKLFVNYIKTRSQGV